MPVLSRDLSSKATVKIFCFLLCSQASARRGPDSCRRHVTENVLTWASETGRPDECQGLSCFYCKITRENDRANEKEGVWIICGALPRKSVFPEPVISISKAL